MKIYSMVINSTTARLFAVTIIAALLASALPVQFYVAAATSAPVNSVTICHATASNSNPYGGTSQTVSVDSIITVPNGHETHDEPVWFDGSEDWGDIIPPFAYYENDVLKNFTGLNWDEGQDIWNDNCEVPGPQSVDIKFVKIFDGVTGGFEPHQFDFEISGDISIELDSDEEYMFTAGSYTVTEKGPEGFNPDNWRIKWSCPDVNMTDGDDNDHDATFVVTEDNYRDGAIFCTAENQYRPLCTDEAALNTGASEECEYPPETCDDETATNYEEEGECEYDNGGGNDDETGTIVVVKEVTASSSTSTPFTFDPSWDAEFILAASDFKQFELATGTYSVAESMTTGWTLESALCVHGDQSTSSAASIELSVDETVTCTFTNDEDSDGDGGGGNEDTYLIEGYVWHDDNENTIWDGFGEEASTTEDHLTGWTVQITNGDETHSTTTDASGYYYFAVPAGTWTISEVIMSGWELTTPVDNSHMVIVPALEAQSLTQQMFAFFISTAHAAVVDTFGPFNFGNNQSTSGGGPGPKDDDDGRDTTSTRVSGRNSNSGSGGNDDDDEPAPQVLGEQVSFVPHGAPDAGAGGTGTSFTALLPFALTNRRQKLVR